MPPLQLKDLLALMDGGVTGTAAPLDVAMRAQRHAADVWSDCRLPGPAPASIEYCGLTRGTGKYLCHFNAGRKDCYLIVICAAATGSPEAHLPFDIGAQYRPASFTDLSTNFAAEVTDEMLAAALPRLLEAGGTPAAILENGDGSYLQTYQDGPDQYALEYQLVTTAFHFAAATPATTQEVLRAFRSYAFGKYEWTRDIVWRHQPL